MIFLVKTKGMLTLMQNAGNKVNLMLDSGAYTAWTQRKPIDLKSYIAYIKRERKHIETYFNLDVIPGEPGQKRTADMVEASAKASYDNLKTMTKAGLTPIPVFHLGEDFRWLERMLKDGYDYIGFGGPSWAQGYDLIPWLNRVFDRITDKEGKPIIKAHGLGLASPDLMLAYPWYSCDAVSWALTAAFGSIFCPMYKNDKPDYSQAPMKVIVSKQDRQSGMPKDHYLRFGPLMRKRLGSYLKDHVGIELEEASTNYVKRAQAVVYYYMRLEEEITQRMDIRYKRQPLGWLTS